MAGAVNVARILDARATLISRGIEPTAMEIPERQQVSPSIVIRIGSPFMGMIVYSGPVLRVGGMRADEMEWENVG